MLNTGEAMTEYGYYWLNHWIGACAALVMGVVLGYLYREKTLFDRRKGEFKHKKRGGVR